MGFYIIAIEKYEMLKQVQHDREIHEIIAEILCFRLFHRQTRKADRRDDGPGSPG
jgi:hypothetical protein